MKLWKKRNPKEEVGSKTGEAPREREGKGVTNEKSLTSTDKASGSRRSSTVTDGESG